MKYSFALALSLVASTTRAAQIVGTHSIPVSSRIPADSTAVFTGSATSIMSTTAPVTRSSGASDSTLPVQTGISSSGAVSSASSASGPQPTSDADIASQPWGPAQGPYQAMPYTWMQGTGYQQLPCGYGYKKDSKGACAKEDWYQSADGCYETIIINKKPHCPVAWVTKTVEDVVTVTKTEMKDVTLLATHTMVDVVTQTNAHTVVVTQTREVPTTRIWVSTEIMNETETKLKTMTETKMQTLTTVATQTDTVRSTETDKVLQTRVVTQTVEKTVVQPTTYISVWVSTKIIDNTKTELSTNTKTVVASVTATQTNVVIATETHNQEVTQTVVVPTTFVSVWVSTEVQNETETKRRTISSTVVQAVTATTVVSQVATATVTDQRSVKETQLSDCLNSCKSSWVPKYMARAEPPSASF